ncbi:hypothetical protein D3C72_2073160 [compost metagenome]
MTVTTTLRRSVGSCDTAISSRDFSRSMMPRTVAWSMAVARTTSFIEHGCRSLTAHSTTNCAAVSCESGMVCWKIATWRWYARRSRWPTCSVKS